MPFVGGVDTVEQLDVADAAEQRDRGGGEPDIFKDSSILPSRELLASFSGKI